MNSSHSEWHVCMKLRVEIIEICLINKPNKSKSTMSDCANYSKPFVAVHVCLAHLQTAGRIQRQNPTIMLDLFL